MLIDWFTVVAQIVNFLILVALMKRFLYGRLIAAIDAREQSIAQRLSEAARQEEEAVARNQELARQTEDLEHRKAALLAAAREDADRQRSAILTQAREDVRALETKWRGELEYEKSAFLHEVRSRTAAGILDVTRSALHDLASADLQLAAVNAFLEKIRALDSAALHAFAARGVTVLTREDLPAPVRQSVQATLAERLGPCAAIAFERAPAMPWGIELRGNGQRIGWTPDAYVTSLEDKLRVSLDSVTT